MTGQGPHISFQIIFFFLKIQYLCCILSFLAHIQNIEYRHVLAEVYHISSEQTLNFNSNTFFFLLLKIILYVLQLNNSFITTWKLLLCSPSSKSSPFQITKIWACIILFRRGGQGNPLQYACLENSMDRGAWWATVHGVTKSQT